MNLVDVPETHVDYDEIVGAADYYELVLLHSQGAERVSAAARAQLRRASMWLWAQQQQRETGGGGAS